MENLENVGRARAGRVSNLQSQGLQLTMKTTRRSQEKCLQGEKLAASPRNQNLRGFELGGKLRGCSFRKTDQSQDLASLLPSAPCLQAMESVQNWAKHTTHG